MKHINLNFEERNFSEMADSIASVTNFKLIRFKILTKIQDVSIKVILSTVTNPIDFIIWRS